MNDTITFAAVSAWINVNEAKALRNELIAQGLDKKQVKLSSYRWADLKDHDKGYICRVLVVKGLRPELEVADTKRVKKSKVASFATELATANSDANGMKLQYFCRRNSIDETITA